MAKRRKRPVVVFRRDIRFGTEERIKIPQTPLRPLRLHQRDLVKRELLRPEHWWWTMHRRGPRREDVGGDPRESRAVAKSRVAGTLPERILYQALQRILRLSADADFTFQSSLEGGRTELGGIVADFVFPYLMVVIQVQGPTHTEYLRHAKDQEQKGILESMGYTVWDITDKQCYDEYALEDWLRRHFALGKGRGSAFGAYNADESEDYGPGGSELLEQIMNTLVETHQMIDVIASMN